MARVYAEALLDAAEQAAQADAVLERAEAAGRRRRCRSRARAFHGSARRRDRPRTQGRGHRDGLRGPGQRAVRATSCWSSTITIGSSCCGRSVLPYRELIRRRDGRMQRPGPVRRAADGRPARTACAQSCAQAFQLRAGAGRHASIPTLLGGLMVRVGDWLYDATRPRPDWTTSGTNHREKQS